MAFFKLYILVLPKMLKEQKGGNILIGASRRTWKNYSVPCKSTSYVVVKLNASNLNNKMK